jgi:hypothetical protein
VAFHCSSVGCTRAPTTDDLAGVFAMVALTLAAIGLYGIISYGVATRRPEIGVRLALGAAPHQVANMIFRGGATLAPAYPTIGGAAGPSAFRRTMSMRVAVSHRGRWNTVAVEQIGITPATVCKVRRLAIAVVAAPIVPTLPNAIMVMSSNRTLPLVLPKGVCRSQRTVLVRPSNVKRLRSAPTRNTSPKAANAAAGCHRPATRESQATSATSSIQTVIANQAHST